MLAARAGLVSGLPLMHRTSYIRFARVEEAAALSDLCFPSKAVWGYDPEFMALMPAVLGFAGEDITCRRCELHPSMDDAGVLPSREMRPLLETAREQVSTPAAVESGQPFADCVPGLQTLIDRPLA
jgi:hypothetical protein